MDALLLESSKGTAKKDNMNKTVDSI